MITCVGSCVTFDKVSVTLGGVSILCDVSASVPCGGSTAFVGPNGAGKTTLLSALLGLVPYTGTIGFHLHTDGKAPRIGYVPQRLAFDRTMPLSVAEFLACGQQRMPLWLGVGKRSRERSREFLSFVRSDDLIDRPLGALSGGEQQRVLLAHALSQEPELLVLDEPAAGVDVQGEMLFCELLESLRSERRFTQIMVSHDLSTVMHHANHVVLLNKRVAAEGTPAEVLSGENLRTTFGLHMGSFEAHLSGKQQLGTAPCCGKEGCHG